MNLNDLILTFTQHADEADLQRKQDADRYKRMYPDSEIPKHYSDEFNLARAMAFMCAEIQALKESCK